MKKLIAVLLVAMTLLSLAATTFAEAYRPSSSSLTLEAKSPISFSTELVDCPKCHQHTCWKETTVVKGNMNFTDVWYRCMNLDCGYRAESFTGISGISHKTVY